MERLAELAERFGLAELADKHDLAELASGLSPEEIARLVGLGSDVTPAVEHRQHDAPQSELTESLGGPGECMIYGQVPSEPSAGSTYMKRIMSIVKGGTRISSSKSSDKDFEARCLMVQSALLNLNIQHGEGIISGEVLEDLKKIKQILVQKDISISVFGRHNCGKSTFLNALLGDEFLPVYAMSETSLSVRIQHDINSHQGVCASLECPYKESKTCPHLEISSTNGTEVIYGRANIEEYLVELNRKVREEVINSESLDVVLKANIPLLVGSVPEGWTVSLVDNPGFGEAKEHVTHMASVSMRISSAFIYLLETGSIGGEEAAKFFKTLVEKEALSCALTDHRLMVGITKFDLNYSSKRSRGRSKPSEKEVQKSVRRSIKEATSIDISEDCIIPLCSEWALSSSKLAGVLVSDPLDEKEERLKDALKDLEKYPHLESLPRRQGENITDNPGRVIECLEQASGIHALKERIRYVVEVACVKAWATNLCNQFKSCSAKVEENICNIMAKKTADMKAMEDDLEQSSSQYESIMGRKNKIKSKTSRKGKEGKEVLESLEQSYKADLKASNVQEKGKIKVKALIENFEESCRAKVANKSFSPATFKTDVDKFLHESASELQEVFDQRRFDNTERTLRRCVGEAIKSIGRLETDVMILCRSIKEKEVTQNTVVDEVKVPLSSSVTDSAQSLGEIRMRIKIPDVSLRWWQRVAAYFRRLFGIHKATNSDSELVQNAGEALPSDSHAYRHWSDEMDEVLHQLQENMEQECDTYFDRIKPELVEFYFTQYCNDVYEHLNTFEAEVGCHLEKEKERLKKLKDSIVTKSRDCQQLIDEQRQLQMLTQDMMKSLIDEFCE